MKQVSVLRGFSIGIVMTVLLGAQAQAMDLDWSGQFRAENHWVSGTSLGNGSLTDARVSSRGYSVPGSGSDEAHFQTLFLRLKPKLIVNDNVAIRSEWWLGDPIYGFYGSGAPYGTDQRQFYSNQSRGSSITAQRLWADFTTEFGTLQVGRAPMNFGLGLVWNAGDGLWDRYQSTGDTLRLVSRFGAFSVIPSLTKYSMGNTVGGGCTYSSTTGVCTPVDGGGGVSDYSIQFQYVNAEDDFKGGVNFIKRIQGSAQDPNAGYFGAQSGTVAGANYNTWDLYAEKTLGKLKIAGELPITNGDLGGLQYKTYALALETSYKPNDDWNFYLKGGHVPGQPSDSTTSGSNKYRAFFFNPNYKIALIMFNYQFYNFGGPNTQNNSSVTGSKLASIYDAPITNANYLAWGGGVQTDKWNFRLNLAWARANEVAEPGKTFYNTWLRQSVVNATNKTQSRSLGWEMDYGTSFQWDDTFGFHFDFGWWFPGDYYRFSNTGTDNANASVFASTFKIGVNF